MAEFLPNILGRWRIVEIAGNPDDGRSEYQPFIHFEPNGSGEFAFGFVQGFVDHRLLERDGKPAVEWTWHGTDEMDDVCGRGWAVLQKDHSLRGKFFIHQVDEMDFVAKKIGAKKAGAFINPASKPTPLQGQYLAFIYNYTKLNGQPPAEADMQRHFGSTPPTVHQMVLTLEKRGLIQRTPGAARSIRLLVPRDQLPVLE